MNYSTLLNWFNRKAETKMKIFLQSEMIIKQPKYYEKFFNYQFEKDWTYNLVVLKF